MKHSIIRLGTRGSALALRQAEIVRAQLVRNDPNISIDVCVIKTQGDRIHSQSLSQMGGDGIFVKELEEALVQNEIDLAVHSLKDVPTTSREDLIMGAVLKRDHWKDIFVSSTCPTLKELNETEQGVVGTSSLRRMYQVRHAYPNVALKDIRGNIDTRLKKMEKGEYDGLIMSAAGLKRLGCDVFNQEELDFIPAPGQGAIALQLRKNHESLYPIVRKLNHDETEKEVTLERFFLKSLGGGCQIPLGAKATLQGQVFFLETFYAALDGGNFLKHNVNGFFKEHEVVIQGLVKNILESLK